MAASEPFRSLAEYRAERQRWAQASEAHAGRLRGHLARLKEPELRKSLFREALGGMIRGALPQNLAGALSSAGVGTALQWALGSGKAGWAKRALLTGLSLVAPSLLARAEQLPVRSLIREVGVSLQRIKDYLRSR